MEKVAHGLFRVGNDSWEIYKTSVGRYQLRIREIDSGLIRKEWLCSGDVPEWCKNASWIKSAKLLELE